MSSDHPAPPSLDLAAGMQIEQPVLNSMIRQTSAPLLAAFEAKPVPGDRELFEVEGDTPHVAAIDSAIARQCQNPFPRGNYRLPGTERTPAEVVNMPTTMPKNPVPFPQTVGTWYLEFNGYTVFSGLRRISQLPEQHPVLF